MPSEKQLANLKRGNNPDGEFKSGRQAAEAGRKGGIASGKAKRQKNAARKTLEYILTLQPKITPAMRANMSQLGFDEDAQPTTEDLIMVAMMQKSMKGDVRATELYLSMMGEDPKTVLEEKRLKLEKEAVKAMQNSDGFMEAMRGEAEEVFADGGDTPDAIEDE